MISQLQRCTHGLDGTKTNKKQITGNLNELFRELADAKLEIAVLKDLLKKNEPALAEKLEVAESYIKKGHPVQKIIKYTSIANSTWYQRDKHIKEYGRHKNPGRPIPGFTINPDGSVIPDELIISALVNYRNRK